MAMRSRWEFPCKSPAWNRPATAKPNLNSIQLDPQNQGNTINEETMQDWETEIAKVEMEYRFHLEKSRMLWANLKGMLQRMPPEERQKPGMRMLKESLGVVWEE